MLALDFKSLAILALLAALIAATVVLITAPRIADLPSLPRTEHAQEAHQGQAWDTEKIIGVMTGGGCGNVNVFACDDGTFLYLCANPDDASKLLGLFVSQTTGKVITGYAARTSYWTGKANSCTPIEPGVLVP